MDIETYNVAWPTPITNHKLGHPVSVKLAMAHCHGQLVILKSGST